MALAWVMIAGVIIRWRVLCGVSVPCLGRGVLVTFMFVGKLSRCTGDGAHRNSHEHDRRESNPDHSC